MFSHIMLGASDIEASRKFYDATLGSLGYGPGVMVPKGRVFYITDTGIFAISTPIDGNPATAANGGTIGFASPSVEASEAWHAAGLVNGERIVKTHPVSATVTWALFTSLTFGTHQATRSARCSGSNHAATGCSFLALGESGACWTYFPRAKLRRKSGYCRDLFSVSWLTIS